MKYNKIIFLDIDGVVNLSTERFEYFNSESIERLETIIRETGAKIVVSSSWRTEHEKMCMEFRNNGMSEFCIENIVGITIRGYNYVSKGSSLPIVRGNEIKHWVDRFMVYPWHGTSEFDEAYRINDENGKFIKMKSNRKDVDFSYIILDDDSDMLYEQRNNFLQTKHDSGITEEVMNKAIQILNIIDK